MAIVVDGGETTEVTNVGLRCDLLQLEDAVLGILGCKPKPGQIYDSMRFERQGGGNLVFSIFPTKNEDSLFVRVIQYAYRDTLACFSIRKGSSNEDAFDALHSVLKGEADPTGNAQPANPGPLVGTWAYLYLVRDAGQVEITNQELRTALMKFEDMIKDLL